MVLLELLDSLVPRDLQEVVKERQDLQERKVKNGFDNENKNRFELRAIKV